MQEREDRSMDESATLSANGGSNPAAHAQLFATLTTTPGAGEQPSFAPKTVFFADTPPSPASYGTDSGRSITPSAPARLCDQGPTLQILVPFLPAFPPPHCNLLFLTALRPRFYRYCCFFVSCVNLHVSGSACHESPGNRQR
jgi:hypothetical protein